MSINVSASGPMNKDENQEDQKIIGKVTVGHKYAKVAINGNVMDVRKDVFEGILGEGRTTGRVFEVEFEDTTGGTPLRLVDSVDTGEQGQAHVVRRNTRKKKGQSHR